MTDTPQSIVAAAGGALEPATCSTGRPHVAGGLAEGPTASESGAVRLSRRPPATSTRVVVRRLVSWSRRTRRLPGEDGAPNSGSLNVIVHTRLESAHLAGNLLGDPSERDLFVYLPPGYEDSDQRYPTAYLLQAYGETVAEMVTPPDRRAALAAADRGRPRARVPAHGRAADDRRDPGRLVALGLRPVGRFTGHGQLRAVRPPRRRPCRRRGLPNDPGGAESGRVRLLVRRVRRVEPRVAQPRCVRRAGHAVGRLVPGHDPQVHALQVSRRHLARGTQWSDREQHLVAARVRLLGDLLTQSGQPSLLRRPARGVAQRRAAAGRLGPLAELRPGRQRARAVRQSPEAVAASFSMPDRTTTTTSTGAIGF